MLMVLAESIYLHTLDLVHTRCDTGLAEFFFICQKYHRTFDIPPETDIETAKSSYNNGILEITFKKKQTKTKGKTIKVE